MFLKTLLLFVAMFTLSTANALDNKYFTTSGYEIEKVEQADRTQHMLNQECYSNKPLTTFVYQDIIETVEIAIDRIVNIGSKLWSVVDGNKPIYNYKVDTASAVPAGIKRWDQLECWQSPVTNSYRVVYKNAYGGKVVDFHFKVMHTYGGQYKGQGRYLSNVTAMVKKVDLVWGYKLNGGVQVEEIVNVGTSQNPVAAMTLSVRWSIHTPFKTSEETEIFFIRGDSPTVQRLTE